jgi:hypothetical protein
MQRSLTRPQQKLVEVLFLAAATEKGRKTTARLQPHRAVVKSMNRAAELVLKKTLL